MEIRFGDHPTHSLVFILTADEAFGLITDLLLQASYFALAWIGLSRVIRYQLDVLTDCGKTNFRRLCRGISGVRGNEITTNIFIDSAVSAALHCRSHSSVITAKNLPTLTRFQYLNKQSAFVPPSLSPTTARLSFAFARIRVPVANRQPCRLLMTNGNHWCKHHLRGRVKCVYYEVADLLPASGRWVEEE